MMAPKLNLRSLLAAVARNLIMHRTLRLSNDPYALFDSVGEPTQHLGEEYLRFYAMPDGSDYRINMNHNTDQQADSAARSHAALIRAAMEARSEHVIVGIDLAEGPDHAAYTIQWSEGNIAKIQSMIDTPPRLPPVEAVARIFKRKGRK